MPFNQGPIYVYRPGNQLAAILAVYVPTKTQNKLNKTVGIWLVKYLTAFTRSNAYKTQVLTHEMQLKDLSAQLV